METTISNLKTTKFTNALSEEIFAMTYACGDEIIDERLYKVAKYIASAEATEELKEYWTQEFYEMLCDFKFVPGGRILSNAGTEYKGTTFFNCYVDGFSGEDKDSMEGIMEALRRQALILKSEGGYGFNCSVLRPRGAYIHGIGNSTPGVVKMLEMWDKQSEVITEGSGIESTNKASKKKIRKGAQLACLNINHPDIEEFITAKQTPGRLSHFNLSVGISDEFMYSVKNHLPWYLEFPDFDAGNISCGNHIGNMKFVGDTLNVKSIYKKEWDGNLKKWKENGLPTKIYKTYNDANELWDLIMKATYNRNEPGVLFIDTINKMNNLYYNEYIDASNPCGEQPLPARTVCLLGNINLTQFVDLEKNNFDIEKIKKIIRPIVRFMDNVNDLSTTPLQDQKTTILKKRRIGLGVMGLGSALLMLKTQYGSDRSIEIVERLFDTIENTSFQISSELALEKGSFEEFEVDKYINGNHIKTLWPETIEMIKQNGLRNSHLTSVAPTGNTSLIANCVSGGLEPVISYEYIRTVSLPYPPNDLKIPLFIDWENKKFTMDINTENYHWNFITEGDDILLKCVWNDITYKIDKNRGLSKETLVEDYGVKILKSRGEWDPKASWASNINNLTVDDHINILKVIAKSCCGAMSKTINLPNDYPYEKFKNIYTSLYNNGIKGGTTYRIGTMASVITTKEDNKENIHIPTSIENRNGHIIYNPAPKRPQSVLCDVHQLTSGGTQWTVFVGMMKTQDDILSPFEVFAFKKKNIVLPAKIKKGTLTKVKRGVYNFTSEDGLVLENIAEFFDLDEQEALTRSISLALRHGAHVKFVVEQLNKSEGGIMAFSKAIAKTLKKYISNNETVSGDNQCPLCKRDHALVYIEGCVKCQYCEYSLC